MEEREQITENTLKLLRSIKTVEDLKEHKEEILALIEELMQTAMGILRSFFESADKLSVEEKQKEMAKFQDESFLLGEEITKEMDRISELSGVEEFIDELQGEMEARMAPYMEEFAEQMSKLMGDFMGQMMEGMVEGMGSMMESLVEPVVDESELDFENLEPIKVAKSIQSLDDFKEKKDELFNGVKDLMNSDLELAKNLLNSDASSDEINKTVYIINKRQSYIGDEMEKEFERFDKFPGAEDYAESIIEDKIARIETIAIELGQMIDLLRQRISSGRDVDESISEPEERENLEQLTFFYYINSLDDLKRDKNILFESLEETLNFDIEGLNDIKEILADNVPYEQVKYSVEKIENKHMVIDKELQSEFSRLAALPGAAEYVKSLKEELMSHFQDKVMELHNLIEELKK